MSGAQHWRGAGPGRPRKGEGGLNQKVHLLLDAAQLAALDAEVERRQREADAGAAPRKGNNGRITRNDVVREALAQLLQVQAIPCGGDRGGGMSHCPERGQAQRTCSLPRSATLCTCCSACRAACETS